MNHIYYKPVSSKEHQEEELLQNWLISIFIFQEIQRLRSLFLYKKFIVDITMKDNLGILFDNEKSREGKQESEVTGGMR